MLNNLIFPPYVKWVAYGLLAISIFTYGYIQGIEDRVDAQVNTVYVQGKTTTKVITKYIKQKEKQQLVDKEIKDASHEYATQFADDGYKLNNTFVGVHDAAVQGKLPTLPSGNAGESSGISVSESLPVFVENLQIGKQWKERALLCESWVKEQEELAK